MTNDPQRCELCGRLVPELTRHHLIPRTRHSKKSTRREFDREELKQRLAMFCRPCHKQVHALYDEKTLEKKFSTLEALANDPEIKRFVDWIKKKPGSANVTVFATKKR